MHSNRMRTGYRSGGIFRWGVSASWGCDLNIIGGVVCNSGPVCSWGIQLVGKESAPEKSQKVMGMSEQKSGEDSFFGKWYPKMH